MERRKALLLAASKKDTGDLSQSSVSPNSKSREVFKLRVHRVRGSVSALDGEPGGRGQEEPASISPFYTRGN